MIVPKVDFELLRGEPKFYASPADSGYFLNRGFCSTCGSPVLATENHRPLLVLVHAGSMDDPGRFEPAADIFVSRAQPWDHMDPDLPKIPEMPPLPDTELFRVRQGQRAFTGRGLRELGPRFAQWQDIGRGAYGKHVLTRGQQHTRPVAEI